MPHGPGTPVTAGCGNCYVDDPRHALRLTHVVDKVADVGGAQAGTVSVLVTSTPVLLSMIVPTDRVGGRTESVVWAARHALCTVAVLAGGVGPVVGLVAQLVLAVHVVIVAANVASCRLKGRGGSGLSWLWSGDRICGRGSWVSGWATCSGTWSGVTNWNTPSTVITVVPVGAMRVFCTLRATHSIYAGLPVLAVTGCRGHDTVYAGGPVTHRAEGPGDGVVVGEGPLTLT